MRKKWLGRIRSRCLGYSYSWVQDKAAITDALPRLYDTAVLHVLSEIAPVGKFQAWWHGIRSFWECSAGRLSRLQARRSQREDDLWRDAILGLLRSTDPKDATFRSHRNPRT